MAQSAARWRSVESASLNIDLAGVPPGCTFFGARIRRETAIWADIIRARNISAE